MLAIKGGKIVPVTGSDIENGVILVENGKIAAVGDSTLPIPESAEVIDAAGQWLYPGFVEVSSHIGANREPNDFVADLHDGAHDGVDTDEPMAPQLRVQNSINPRDNTIKWVISSGITTSFVSAGPGCLIDGQGVAIKIRDVETVDELVICGSEQMCFTLGDEAIIVSKRKKRSPTTRMRAIDMLRDVLRKAKKYADMPEANRVSDPQLEALMPVARGEMTARFECLRADDIAAAVKLGEEFHLKYMVVGGHEAHAVSRFLKEHEVPVALEAVPFGPVRCMPMIQRFDFQFETAAILEAGGNLQSITVNENGQTRRLPILAGFSTAYGLSHQAALESITIRPARLLGLADRIGSLEVGKDADIAIFNGDALLNTSRCIGVMVEGTWNYRERSDRA